MEARKRMARSLNVVQLIGNLTRDPELRYTSSGRPVCDIGLATNRQWKTESGERKEEADFHKVVVWGKLGEICSQYLKKGSKAYFKGRLTTRSWTAQDGTQKYTTEIIADDMILLPSGREDTPSDESPPMPQEKPELKEDPSDKTNPATTQQETKKVSQKAQKEQPDETTPEPTGNIPAEEKGTQSETEVNPDEMPF